ncbi:hypothetical protein CEP53_011220 [Fusarium sp. AF-6]|nr:hypothetical protein CEP53_011220 [Fusarium sp. AF-6]
MAAGGATEAWETGINQSIHQTHPHPSALCYAALPAGLAGLVICGVSFRPSTITLQSRFEYKARHFRTSRVGGLLANCRAVA